MLASKTIAVVIPAHNEERLIGRTLRGLPGFVDVAVVVDDASQDRTIAEAEAVGRERRVVVCPHTRNQGVGAAIVTGYRWCLDHGVDLAVVVGADNQMHPDDMAGLVLPLLRGEADYAIGDRLAWPEGWRAFPWQRLVGVVALAAMTRWATGFAPLRDAQCGYTAITRGALAAMPLDRLYPRYGFPNDMLAKALLAGARVVTRPVRPIYAEETSALSIPRVVMPLVRLTLDNRQARLNAEAARPPHAPTRAPTIASSRRTNAP